jgi:hypothetical protein
MPASALGASQRQELEALAANIGFRFVLVGDRLTILDGPTPIFQSFSIPATFGFLRGCKHTLRVAEVTDALRQPSGKVDLGQESRPAAGGSR